MPLCVLVDWSPCGASSKLMPDWMGGGDTASFEGRGISVYIFYLRISKPAWTEDRVPKLRAKLEALYFRVGPKEILLRRKKSLLGCPLVRAGSIIQL